MGYGRLIVAVYLFFFVHGFQDFMPSFHGRLGELFAAVEFLAHFGIAVLSLVPPERPVNRFAIFYIDNKHSYKVD